MNSVAVTGRVATTPVHTYAGFMHRTRFSIEVTTGRRQHTLDVVALNDLAKSARCLTIGDPIGVTGYLHAEPFDMPDRTIWHRVDIVAYEIDRQPTCDHEPAGTQR